MDLYDSHTFYLRNKGKKYGLKYMDEGGYGSSRIWNTCQAVTIDGIIWNT